MKGLHVRLSKRLGKLEIDVAFSCPEGSTLALIGPSGAGKTTIIRMVAGLERPDDGAILFNGETFFDQEKGIRLSPQKRGLGYVFQDYTLFSPSVAVRQCRFLRRRTGRRSKGCSASSAWVR